LKEDISKQNLNRIYKIEGNTFVDLGYKLADVTKETFDFVSATPEKAIVNVKTNKKIVFNLKQNNYIYPSDDANNFLLSSTGYGQIPDNLMVTDINTQISKRVIDTPDTETGGFELLTFGF
jgi:hypothetical protein